MRRLVFLAGLFALACGPAEEDGAGPSLESGPESAPPPADEGGCGTVDYLGACNGAAALFCHEGELHAVDCAEHDLGCGWVDESTGYYCGGEGTRPGGPEPTPPVEPPPEAPEPQDPPEDPPPAEEEDPPPTDAPPEEQPESDDGCHGVDYHGRCEGDVAVWCASDMQLRREDCAASGDSCGWVNEDIGYYCGGQPGRPDSGGDDQPPPPPDRPDPPGEACGSAAESHVVDLANAARSMLGMGPLRCDPLMTQAARLHSQDMCDQGYFDHTGRDGSQPWDRMQRAGVRFDSAGENIAWGYGSPQSVHDGWMTSPGHRANLLGQWGRIGVGLSPCGGDNYWTQVFAD